VVFPDGRGLAAKLEAHGFALDQIDLIPRPTLLQTDMAGWLDTFAESFFGRLPAEQRDEARAEVLALLAPYLLDERGRWTVDYVRLRFAARLALDRDGAGCSGDACDDFTSSVPATAGTWFLVASRLKHVRIGAPLETEGRCAQRRV
jgi:hypothetical protein